MSKRTPEETLEALLEQGDDDEMERVLAMSPEEREAELRKAGFDVDAERGAADALRQRRMAGPGDRAPGGDSRLQPAAARSRARDRRVVMLLAAAFACAALVLALNRRDPGESGPGPGPTSPAVPPTERAAALRRIALEACKASNWDRCERELDQARGLDPAGEAGLEVRKWRAQIEAARSGPSRSREPDRK
jgi:hypothetical protein